MVFGERTCAAHDISLLCGAQGPSPHRGLGKPEQEDQALVEEPAPGVLIHMVYGHLHIDFNYKYVCMCGEGGLHTQISPGYG